MLCVASVPSSADAKRRAGAPPAKVVKRALQSLVNSTSFPSGRAAAQQALGAFKRKKQCRASDALLTHRKRVAKELSLAKRQRNRSLAKRYGALERRSVRARILLLRSLPVGKACGGPATVMVNPAMKPQAKLPRIRGFGNRPIARMQDPYGNAVDFVSNELIVKAPSLASLKPFLARWRGKVLATVDLAPLGGKSKQFLVRIDVDRADTDRLVADIAALSKTRGSVTTVSSGQGLELLAAAARESRTGVEVGINFVSPGTAIASGTSIETSSGPDGFSPGSGFSLDAFSWKHLSATSTQGVGTAEAWRLLERSGRSANKVGLAVLDMGFAPRTNGPDFGEPLAAISNVPFTDALGTRNLSGCGSSPCPWHGTNVANTAFAVPDNGLGVAGTAGPVPRRIAVFTLYDFFTSISAVVAAGVAGAQVLNMSYGAPVPAAFSWTVLPFEIATGLANSAGMVLAAAAGNDSTDVDEEDCFIVCWEETLWTPCENVGVFCVGALAHDSTERASYSNWGRRGGGVDLFAPGTVLVGPDPATSRVHSVNGTSFASPYLAGVAALVKAADPSLSAGAIERILVDTAKTSPDGRVRRYVHALAAVKRALPRLMRIESPLEGSSFRRGSSVSLSVFVYDDDLGAPTSIVWTLPEGTVIGSGATASTNALPYGATEIRATAVFSDGTSLSETVRVSTTNDAPTVEILQPNNGETFFKGETVPVSGLGRDVNQIESGFELRDSQLAWFRDGSTTPFATGREAALNLTGVPVGTHTITLRGTDDVSATAEQTITIEVDPEPVNFPPVVDITSPANNAKKIAEFQDPAHSNQWYATFNFLANASDPESDPLTYKWTDTLVGRRAR